MRNSDLKHLEMRIAKLERQSGLFDIFSNKKKNVTRVAKQVADALLDSNLIFEYGSTETYGSGVRVEILASGSPSYLIVTYDAAGKKELNITILDSSRSRYQFLHVRQFEFGNPKFEKYLKDMIHFNTQDLGERKKFLRAVSGRR